MFFQQKHLKIKKITDDILDSNCFIIAAESGNAVIVDPNSSKEIEQTIQEEVLHIEIILLTHEHYDHIAGVERLKKLTQARIICSKLCADAASDPKKNLSQIFGVQLYFLGKDSHIKIEPYCCPSVDKVFDDYEEICWENHRIRLFRTPGHTSGSTTIVIDEKLVFSGDSLLLENDVIIRKRGGSVEDYKNITIPFYNSLDDQCFIFPGHGNVFRLKERAEYIKKYSSS